VQVYMNQNKRLVRGTILTKLGSSVYIVRLKDDQRSVKKHANQILKYKGEEEHGLDCGTRVAPATSVSDVPDPAEMPPIVLAHPSTSASIEVRNMHGPPDLSGQPPTTEMMPMVLAHPSLSTDPMVPHTLNDQSIEGNLNQGTTEHETDGERWLECDDTGPGLVATELTAPPSLTLECENQGPEDLEATGKRPRKNIDYKQFF
jgi:hypothetical protein